MAYWNRIGLSVCAGWLGFILSGCAPTASGPWTAQRDPYFLLGENRIQAGNYRGAVQAFEKSLEVNPRSAAAEFALGWLYDQKVSSPAAAIYHYERYLKLDPDAGNADVVKQRIEGCKQKLAVDVLALPSSIAVQRQVDELVTQNQQLNDEIHWLQDKLNAWTAYYTNLMAMRDDTPRGNANRSDSPQPVYLSTSTLAQAADLTEKPSDAQTGRLTNPIRRKAWIWRTHTVVAGDTAFLIARRCGVSLGALLAANPGLDPRRMEVGSVLNIPPPRLQ